MLKYQEHIDKIIQERKLNTVFPKRVIGEADATPQIVPAKDMRGRLDLRDKILVTVDGEDAKDFDDAVSLEIIENNYRLGVHIADVSHYVKPRSLLDGEAYRRATSVYFPEFVIPMLPKSLSNGICSLNEGVDRLCLSIIMDIDAAGDVLKYEIKETVIKSKARMTYTSVAKIFAGDGREIEKYPEITLMLTDMKKLTGILCVKRQKRGAVDFDLPETKIELDTGGEVVTLAKADRNDAHKMIEEFMLTANEVAATHMFNLKAPFIYRVHEKPSLEKIENLYALANALGFKMKDASSGVKPKDVQRLVQEASKTQYAGLLNKTALRSMMKAKYTPENLGHFGLALKNYCHFTSPIRRYPDLVVHRMIKLWLHDVLFTANQRSLKSFVLSASTQSSECEVQAESAERDVDDFYKAVFMSRHLGEEYDAVISGVTSFGIFAELPNTAEGLIWLENLPGGQYNYVENRHLLQNKHNSYRMGDKIRVRVVKCDIDARKIEFMLI